MTDEPRADDRFLTPTQVAEELNVKPNQVHALIKAGELRAFRLAAAACGASAGRTLRTTSLSRTGAPPNVLPQVRFRAKGSLTRNSFCRGLPLVASSLQQDRYEDGDCRRV